MKKLILASVVLAPLAVGAPAFAQVNASPNAAVTRVDTAPQEFISRRGFHAPWRPYYDEQIQIDRQGPAGNF